MELLDILQLRQEFRGKLETFLLEPVDEQTFTSIKNFINEFLKKYNLNIKYKLVINEEGEGIQILGLDNISNLALAGLFGG